MNKLLLSLILLGLSSSANANWLEDVIKVAVVKEVIEQVESGEITEIGVGTPREIITESVGRVGHVAKTRAQIRIYDEKAAIRTKIEACADYRMRCKL